MARPISRDVFDSVAPIEMQKGRTERLVIQPWVRSGFAYLSLGIMDQQEDGTYAFLRKKGFALTMREGRELVFKLAAQVNAMEQALQSLSSEAGDSGGSEGSNGADEHHL